MATARLPLALAAVACVLSAALVACSARYFTSFTWKDSSDINPCEMSYFHLIHFPTPVHSSAQPSSPTYRSYDEQPHAAERLPIPSSALAIVRAHAAGYRVLRYVEHGHDDSVLLGQPVLFLPGSSGNYHQSRSLFSRLNTLHTQLHPHSPQAPADPCDYFAVDTLEEKSAFSSAIVLQQAHYVNDAIQWLLHRYRQAGRSNVTSVILVAHSMGGTVARILPYLVNWQPDSVRSLYTLGTPHAAPVLVADEGMRLVYSQLAAEVRSGQLRVPVHLSVAGGVNDFFIEPSLAALPAPAALAGVSSGLPHVQTSIEHQALCWCRQLMELTAALIERDAQLHNPQHPQHISHAHQLARFPPSPFHTPAHYVEVRMTAADVRVELPGHSVLAMVEGQVRRAQVCGQREDRPGQLSCEDVTAQLTDITTLYRDHPFPLPRSSTTMRSAIHIRRGAFDTSAPLDLLLSKSQRSNHTAYMDSVLLMSVTPATKHPLSSLPAHPSAGVYLWQYYVPAGVDRYFDLSLHAASAASAYEHPVFVHFSSLRVGSEASWEDEWHEDTFVSQLNVDTVVRYHRRPFARLATAFIALPPINSSTSASPPYRLQLSLSPYSYLRTLFLQLPIASHFLLAAFLLLIAAQHRVLHTQQRFPHVHQLPSCLSKPLLALLLFSSFCLFALFCPGTQYHARAFYEQSEVVARAVDLPVLQLWSHARVWSGVNGNETGVACFVLFAACVGVVAAVQLLLWLLLTALSLAVSALRRCGAVVPSALLMLWRLLVLAATVAVVAAMWWHVDAAIDTHFHVSVLASLTPFLHATLRTLLSSLLTLSPPPVASTLSLLLLYPDTVQLVAVYLLFLTAQACQWDRTRPSLCAYQLSCATLALFAFLLTAPHLLTFLSLPATQPSAPLVTVSALHLVLLVCSCDVPPQSPVLQSVVWLVYGVTLLFASDASMSLQSLYVVYAVVMLCYLPHAVRCSVALVLDAFVALKGLPKAQRGHVE